MTRRPGLTFAALALVLAALASSACGSDEPADVLGQCIQHETISTHIHVLVIAVLDGQPASLPANLGITADCMRPMHTHDDSSLVHIESPTGHPFTLADLLTVWGEDNPYAISALDSISINGIRSEGAPEDAVFEDGQRVVLDYRTG